MFKYGINKRHLKYSMKRRNFSYFLSLKIVFLPNFCSPVLFVSVTSTSAADKSSLNCVIMVASEFTLFTKHCGFEGN